jgi:hypothetical protein
MLPPSQQRRAERLRELIEEGNAVAALERRSDGMSYIPDPAAIQAWLAKVANAIETTFGNGSSQLRHWEDLMSGGPGRVQSAHRVLAIVGLLSGAVDDLEHGYLLGQEFLIAGELFDSLLDQASHLNDRGYKDPAAVLGRVVLEDALARIARREGIDKPLKATALNDELKKANVYGQPQWRQVQVWLDIGNSAAHGKFDQFTTEGVKTMIAGISQFLASQFEV